MSRKVKLKEVFKQIANADVKEDIKAYSHSDNTTWTRVSG